MLKDSRQWFHGTIDIYAESFRIDGVRVLFPKSIRPKDFGLGFYLTSNRAEAVDWANKKAERYNLLGGHHAQPLVLTFEIAHSWRELRSQYHLQDFQDVYSASWFDFVLLNRQELVTPVHRVNGHSFDLVYGLIADGKANEMMSIFSNRSAVAADFRKKQAMINKLKMPAGKAYQDQLCICSQQFADRELLMI